MIRLKLKTCLSFFPIRVACEQEYLKVIAAVENKMIRENNGFFKTIELAFPLTR
jgi:hypothetical protein